MDTQHTLITKTEVARLFGTTPSYIGYLVSRGVLKGRKVGRRTYFSREAVESLFAELNDTVKGQRELDRLNGEINKQEQQLRDALHDLSDESSLLHFLRKVPYSKDIAITALSTSGRLDGRQLGVIKALLDGWNVGEVEN